MLDINHLGGPHYVSYVESVKRFPANILMLPYEKLKFKPDITFSLILSFCGCLVLNHRKAFSKALQATRPETLRKVELKLGNTLAFDQCVDAKKESHMRGGEIGKWKMHFSDRMLEYAELQLRIFGLSLNNFQLEQKNQAMSHSPA